MKETVSYEKRREAIRLRGTFADWAESIIFALTVVLVFNVAFRIVSVNGPSMLPTLHSGDRLIVSQLHRHYAYGDIIISVQPNARDEAIIKRVIAVGGQTVDIDEERGTVLVDGQELEEPYIYETIMGAVPDQIAFPVTVPEGNVFVMGDNRNDSLDSRSSQIGMIEERYILGEAVWRFFPFEDFGRLA